MKKPVVLLIDDEKAYAEVIQEALEAYGLQTIVANNAMEALTLFQQASPDLVLLDVMMPEIDGLQLLSWLREHSEREELPIHIVSARSQPDEQKAAINAGATGFLAKPFTINELQKLMDHYFSSSSGELMPES